MATKKQTRRSISLAGLTYARIAQHCTSTEQSVSGYIERLIAADLDAKGVPAATALLGRRPKHDPHGDLAGHIFSF